MKNSLSFKNNIRIAFVSAVTGTFAVLFFIAVFSAVSVAVDFSDRICSAASHLSLLAGSFAAGAVNAFFRRRKGWIHGSEGGGEIFIIFAAVCILSGTDMTAQGIFFSLLTSLTAGFFGGITGVNIKMSDKKYRLINRFLYNA